MRTNKDILTAIADFDGNVEAFSRYTSPQLWNDPWISRQMLATHLDPGTDLASRRPEFIDESVAFLDERFGLGSASSVVDFGCGPGLYAARLARLGARVTGIDLSERSLEYARAEAARAGLRIDYLLGDYLEVRAPVPADLAIMIYCDFGVLGPERRKRLLANVRASLKPGGAFFFDVCGLEMLAEAQEIRSWTYEDAGGFFGPGPYLHLHELRKYPLEEAFVEKHLVAAENGIRSYFCWNACFSEESLAEELAREGFTVEDIYADARGRRRDGGGHTLAVAARVCAT
jgi:SAM-dependent methyltransferase